MAERDYSNNYDDYWRDYPDGQHPGGVTAPSSNTQPSSAPAPMPQNYVDPQIEETSRRYNGGSPPAIPLQPGHGWEWNGWDWIQVQGRGIGYPPPAAPQTTTNTTNPGPSTPSNPGTPTAQVTGVPPAWNHSNSNLSGSAPTLADAIRDSKQLPGAPAVKEYASFEPPKAVGLEGRNKIIEAIMQRPHTMDQTFQDQLFEQQKEQQVQLANQAKQRMAQMGASRGFAGGGGFQAKALGGVEGDFINNLMAGRRDISVKAQEVNRQNELAAVQMQEAVAQGDYVRANAAYETQLKAKAMYDELRFKAAEFDRANVALAAQTGMANRQQQMAEQVASFQQYLDKLKFEELMRQFNNQMALDWGKFGWEQQNDLTSQFPGQ